MASVFDKIFPKVAANMVGAYGRSVTLKKVTEGAFNAATGAKATTTQSVSIKCVITPMKLSLVDGSNIMAGDVMGTFYAQGAGGIPEVGDIVDTGAGSYRVISVSTVYSGESVAMYEALMRK